MTCITPFPFILSALGFEFDGSLLTEEQDALNRVLKGEENWGRMKQFAWFTLIWVPLLSIAWVIWLFSWKKR